MVLDVALVTFAGQPDGWIDDHLLVDALAARGVTSAFVCWDDPDARWASAGMAVVRSVWDYHLRVEAFGDWADHVGAVTRLWNPAPVLRWNGHKSYLLDLDAAGVPIVPTRVVRRGERVVLGAGAHVVKPAVSIGAERTTRHATQADLDALSAEMDALVQPYVHGIESDGELSIVCIDGVVTHVVQKVPAAGDFRTQEHHGAACTTVEVDDRHRSVAAAALAATPGETMYARVDVVALDGVLSVMELELIEPTLWLRWHPPAADAMADSIVGRLRASG